MVHYMFLSILNCMCNYRLSYITKGMEYFVLL